MASLRDIKCNSCGGCEKVNDIKIYCSEYGTYYYIDDVYNEECRGETCNRYYDGIPKPGRIGIGSDCYITTMVCNLLGYDAKRF